MACRLLAIIWKKASILLIATMLTNFSAFGNSNQNTTTKNSQDIYFEMLSTIFPSLGCVKDYTPTQPNIFQLIDYKKDAMPQVFNATSFWKTCFINNFHEIPSNHSFHTCHNELNFSSYKCQGLGDENNEYTTHATSNGKNSMLCGHHQPEILLTHCDLVRCKCLSHLLI